MRQPQAKIVSISNGKRFPLPAMPKNLEEQADALNGNIRLACDSFYDNR